MLAVDLALSPLAEDQEWALQKLHEKEMELSWRLFKLAPYPYLPQKKQGKRYTLVLELQRTLIYYDEWNKHLKYRPYIDIFLNKLRESFELVVFTTYPLKLAQVLLAQIEKVGRYFDYLLSHAHLTLSKGSLVKDFSRLGRDPRTLLILDHQKSAMRQFMCNCVEIGAW